MIYLMAMVYSDRFLITKQSQRDFDRLIFIVLSCESKAVKSVMNCVWLQTKYMKIMPRSLGAKSCLVLLLSLLFLWATPTTASEEPFIIDNFDGLNIAVSDPQMVTAEVVNSDLLLSIDCSENKQRTVRIPLQRSTKNQKLKLTIAEANHLPYMGKFETNISGQVLRHSFEHNYLDYQKNSIFFSLSDKHHDDLSLYFKCRNAAADVTGTVLIDKIEIVPLEFTDDRDFIYILAEILLLLFLLPGFLLYGLCGVGNKDRLLALLTPLSIFLFLVLYLILLINQKFSFAPNSWALLIAYITLNSFLIAWLAAKKELAILAANFRLIKFELLALFIVTFCVAAIVSENLELPLYTLTYNNFRYLTYGAFGAHDPMFQYINGIAILHDEPFSKYYENSKLFYGVQDRGIIVGVLYAVMRGLANPINANIANSYGFYTLFGSSLNILVLLPVFALHSYFFTGRQRPLLILLLLSASAFIVTNYYITWYKLAGAGLVISGIVLLLTDKYSIKQWLLAGVVWGLATNFHPGLALTYPIVTIWLLFRFWRTRRNRIIPVTIAFCALFGSFLVMNLPWSIVKATHYNDTNVLFRQHFLASQPYDAEHGIAGSIINFTDRFTPEQQLHKRYERLIRSLRLEEIESLFALASKAKWQKVLTVWNRLEASFIIFGFAPLIILLMISGILTRLMPASSWDEPVTRHNTEFRWLLTTQILTIFLIIFGSFGSLSPDITWHIPMSCSVIVIYLLVHCNIALGKIGTSLVVVYALFTYFRLFFQYF